MRKISYREALGEGLVEMMGKDGKVIVMGQSAEQPEAMFGTIYPAYKRFSHKRFFEMPLSEAGITGWGTGAALSGLKPVMTHHRDDFLLLALDQMANHAAKWSYIHRNPVNWTIRAIIGRGWGQGPQHSQSLQAIFAHFPGLKVVMPATPCDAKGLLISAILDPNPVIVIEHRRLYDTIGNVPAGFYKVPLGKAKVVRKGSDLTMVAISEMLLEAGIAAKVLHNVEIEVEIIDPRTIQPLDKNTILKSVEKTGRLIICDTGCKDFGVSAEIAASVAEDAFGYLKSPIKRIGLPFGPTPASYQLENYYYPGVADIIKAVAEILPKDQAGKLRNLTASEAEMSKFIGIF